MRPLLVFPSLLLLAACSTTQLPISPHKIDVQQGNVIDQETVSKLKPGLTRSQVRFLLGTPLVVDPFRDNRWDYVYNYRTAGKLTAQKRLTVFFERDALSRIETEGFDQTTPKAEVVALKPPSVSEPQSLAPVQPEPVTKAEAEQPATLDNSVQQAQLQPKVAAQVKESEPQPAPVAAVPAPPATTSTNTLGTGLATVKTSVVPALETVEKKTTVVKADSTPPQPVALQQDTDADAVKPDVVPTFPESKGTSDIESPVLAAVQNWAKAWSARDEQGYLAAYSDDFKPGGGFTRAEWKKRRKMLLNLSKNIEVQVESPVVEFPKAGQALVTFNQYYRSDTFHDAVIKQLLMGLQDGRWLILEERVMSVLNIIKK
ncbi:MAG: outer membrane protein assembly factor BamE [Thiobacillaceae bacterium]